MNNKKTYRAIVRKYFKKPWLFEVAKISGWKTFYKYKKVIIVNDSSCDADCKYTKPNCSTFNTKSIIKIFKV